MFVPPPWTSDEVELRSVQRVPSDSGGLGPRNAAGSADVENTDADWPHIQVAMPNYGDLSRSKPLRSIADFPASDPNQ